MASIWCLTVSLLLLSINGDVYGKATPVFYEKQETSSPAPPSDQSSSSRLDGMKELVLYLTPEQVQAFEDAGAIVKPFPQFEKAFLQQQQQQSVEEQAEPKYQPAASNEDSKEPKEADEFYKVLNIKEINEDLPLQQQSAGESTEKARPKYKYSPKFRQQDYAYVPKKANKAKSYSTEYVRYLPSYEIEDLKTERYRAQPLPGYRFDDAQLNEELQKYLQTEAPETKKPESAKNPEKNQQILETPVRIYTVQSLRAEQPEESTAKDDSSVEDTGPVTFEGRRREPTKIREPAEVREEPEEIERPVKVKTSSTKKAQKTVVEEEEEEEQEREQEEQEREQEEEALTRPISPPGSAQRQFSSLLAPLVQIEKISESIAEQKKALVNSELAIHSKLQQIKESGNHDEEKYAEELEKLNKNLVEQNALAQKLALEAIAAKEPQTEVPVKEEVVLKDPRPIEILKRLERPVPETVEVRVRQPYPVPLEILRPVAAPVVQKQTEAAKPAQVEKRIPISVSRSVYVNGEKPYIVQKIVPIEDKDEIPLSYSIQQPEKLTIIRHIWEH